MILIGQYDSPFTRRVGITLSLYGMAFEHRPWSITGDAERIAPFNPLIRVPTLVLDDGEVLTETTTILTWLDETVGPDRALLPADPLERRRVQAIAALANGLADKSVALFYELTLHAEPSPMWVDRCGRQIENTLDALEADRAGRHAPWWFGPEPGHADIAVACAIGHLRASHPRRCNPQRFPALSRVSAQCEALPVFKAHYQEFIPPT